jgi:hypothetical protein
VITAPTGCLALLKERSRRCAARTPDALRAKVLTAVILVSTVAASAGFLAAGQVLERWGMEPPFAATTAGISIIALVFSGIVFHHREGDVALEPRAVLIEDRCGLGYADRGRQKRLRGVRPSQAKPAAETPLIVVLRQPPRLGTGIRYRVRPAVPVAARAEK